jgi:hypothetical protein
MRSAVESPALRQGRMSICAYSLTAEVRPCVIRTSPDGQVAQLVEQRTENPRVGGSIPSLATISKGGPFRSRLKSQCSPVAIANSRPEP